MRSSKQTTFVFPLLVLLLGFVLSIALPAGTFGGSSDGIPITDQDFQDRDVAKEELGKLLFFDKVLSGNRNMSCATCHHPYMATGDALALPVGEGGMGLGRSRNTGLGLDAVHERVPRNSPAIFNLGANEFVVMFHDGRVMMDTRHPSGFSTPAGLDLPVGLDSTLAAQAMFPVTSGTEMAGQAGENSIADVAANGNLAGPNGVWEQIAKRLQGIDEYVQLFSEAFGNIQTAEDITYVHAANAIAAYEAQAFRCTNAPFDRYLNGDPFALTKIQLSGKDLFYGKAGCVNCHSGKFQTDHNFYAIGMPQIGPGKGDNLPGYSDGHDDFGRERVTGLTEDRFRFRTPPLRQVTLTGPWGHDGAYEDLEEMVRHHLNPTQSLAQYDAFLTSMPSRADLNAMDFVAHNDPVRRQAIADAIELMPTDLEELEIEQLMAFLNSLTDMSCLNYAQQIPTSVPSGLPLCEIGCENFDPDLPVAQAVARMISNDPEGDPNADHYIGDLEIKEALQLWISGAGVPRTGGKTIDDATMLALITIWANQTVMP